MDKRQSSPCNVLWLFLCLASVSTVSPMGPLKPMPIDYAIAKVTQRQREQFVEEHNKFRSVVNPPAANMEYMFWNDDLGNLAQMWANKCVWDHGFVEFGDTYPNSPFQGQVGQNLARDWGRLHNPADRVNYWYQESRHYKFSRFSTPMVPHQCSKLPCKRYTQLVWANTKFLGCGAAFCDRTFGKPHPWIRGETEVVCDYAPSGNVLGQFPYEVGKPCSKCASGKGFCYKNLCRDCDDFDKECGKSLTLAMCIAFEDFMAKKCPKMCNLCECPLECQNGGKLNSLMCTCACPPGWRSLDCSDAVKVCPEGLYGENCQFRCIDKIGREVCRWRLSNGHQCSASYMKLDCAVTCGICGSPTTKPPLIVTTPLPPSPTKLPVTQPVTQPVTLHGLTPLRPSIKPPSANVTKPSIVVSIGPPNVTQSTPVTVPSVTPLIPPRVIANKPSSVLPVTQSQPINPALFVPDQPMGNRTGKISSRVKGPKFIHCKDENPKCGRWASTGRCKTKSKWMKEHCCSSCQRLIDPMIDNQCNDSDSKCPFWASAGECARDREWMLPNCKRSCNQCGVCRDAGPKCAQLALQDKCTIGDERRTMLTECRQSCGLCQVYDKHDHCPPWSAQGVCKSSNWTWMRDNCPMSCRVPLAEVQFCAEMKDGNYPIPRICAGFVSCSGGLAHSMMCPPGTLFNPDKKICDLPVNVKCIKDKEITLKRRAEK